MPSRFPPPGVAVFSFPSPKVTDLLHVERHDHSKATFGPQSAYREVPEYGTAHPANADFRLTLIRKVDDFPEIGHWYDWVFVNDRASQDDYNFQITYREGNTDYPVYTRTYLIRRTEYEPNDPGAADPAIAELVQVGGDKLTRIEVDWLDSLYVVVTRSFEKVPGLTITTPQLDGNGVIGAVDIQQPVLIENIAENLDRDPDTIKEQFAPLDDIHAKREKTTGALWENSAGSRISDSTWGEPTQISKQVIGIGEAVEAVPDLSTVSLTSQPDGAGRLEVTEEKVNWPPLSYTYVGDRGATVSGTVTKVAPGTALPADTLLTASIKQKPETKSRAELAVETVTSWETLTSAKLDQRGDTETEVDNIVAPGSVTPTGGLLVNSDEVETLTATKAKHRRKTVASRTPLIDYETLANGFRLKTTKTIVAAGTLPGVGTGAGLVNDVIRGLDKFKSEQIIRQVVNEAGADVGHPEIDDVFYDEKTKVKITVTRQVVDPGTTPPTIGSTFRTTGKVFKSKATQIDGSERLLQEVMWGTVPNARSEFRQRGFQFPAVALLGGIVVADTSSAFVRAYPPPYSGNGFDINTYLIFPHRNVQRPAKVYYFYHYGQNTNIIPRQYRVISPGAYSKWWPIPQNCVHPASTVTATVSSGGVVETAVIEDLPASIPPNYHPDEILCVAVEQTEWMGNVWETAIWMLSENLHPAFFPVFYVGIVFKATQQNDILIQPNPLGEYLTVKSTSAGEALDVVVYGKHNGRLKKKKVTLSGTTVVSTDPQKFDKVIHLRAKTSPAGTITLRGQGATATGFADFTAAPATGDTITVGKSGTTRTYTFRTPGVLEIETVAKADHVQGEYVDLTTTPSTGAEIVRFWVSTDGSDTSIPSNPGTRVKVNLLTATTADECAVVWAAAVNTVPTQYAASVVSNTVTVVAVKLGTFAAADTVADVDFALGVLSAGTAVATDQVRTAYTLTTAAAASADVAEYLDNAIDLDEGTIHTSYSGSTTIHADVASAVVDGELTRLALTDKTQAPPSQAWTLSETGTGITVTAFVVTGDGPLIAQLDPAATPPINKHAYKDIIFNNPDLLDGSVDGPGILERMPATVEAVTDAILAPVSSGLKLELSASGSPALPVKYQLSADGVSGWADGAVTLPNIGSNAVYRISISETNVAYIRLRVDNTAGQEARAVHASLLWAVA